MESLLLSGMNWWFSWFCCLISYNQNFSLLFRSPWRPHRVDSSIRGKDWSQLALPNMVRQMSVFIDLKCYFGAGDLRGDGRESSSTVSSGMHGTLGRSGSHGWFCQGILECREHHFSFLPGKNLRDHMVADRAGQWHSTVSQFYGAYHWACHWSDSRL